MSDQLTNAEDLDLSSLIASAVIFISSVSVFTFLMDIDINNFAIKPGYTALVWQIITISSITYYFIRSKGKKTTGNHINSDFKYILKIIFFLLFIGSFLLYIPGSQIITKSQYWVSLMQETSSALDGFAALYVLILFGTGLAGILRFLI